MPKVSWEEVNILIHNVKSHLTTMTKIEILLKKLREDVVSDLDELHKVILGQVEETNYDRDNN